MLHVCNLDTLSASIWNYTPLELIFRSLLREVNKNDLTGWAILNIFVQKSRKIINWVGSLQFWAPLIPSNVFSPKTLRNVAHKTNSDIDRFLDSTEVFPILRVLEWNFQLGVSQFGTNLGLSCLIVIIIMPIFSVGKIIYWVGSFGPGQWAGSIYWVGKVIY